MLFCFFVQHKQTSHLNTALLKIKRIAYLSLGSNLNNKLEHLQNAINSIAEQAGSILNISKVYKTAAWGFNGNPFYNICIKIETYHAPEKLLQILLDIEKHLGRNRTNGANYQNRPIDIDILLFDDAIIFSKNLMVPHPKMLDRKFVLIPLVDIAKNTIHPVTKTQIHACLKKCTDTLEVNLVKEVNLIRPVSITEKYNYIAIEGNIGAGKTSLANMMSDEFNAKLVLERFADNPFLPKFYNDKERYAFPLEMSFFSRQVPTIV
jgi:2-amino-4-hydroxy-6-hydroxymethyldihydropteridine pyrophosphokinase